MGYTPQQERRLALAMIGEDQIRQSVEQAVKEKFGGTYGGEDIAARALDILQTVPKGE